MGSSDQVLIMKVDGGSEMKDPEYRAFTCSALHTIHARVKFAWAANQEDTVAKTHSYAVEGTGDVEIDELLIAKLPSGGSIEGQKLKVFVNDDVGVQDVLRGDPIIGEAEITLSKGILGEEQEIELKRDDEDHGVLNVTFTTDTRRSREVSLCKAACLPDITPGCRGVREEIMCHWGVAVRPKGAGDDHRTIEVNCLEFPNPGPITVHGPKGIIDHNVPEDEVDDWKPRMEEARDYLSSDAVKARLAKAKESGETIPDEEWMSLFPGRKVSEFEDVVTVGQTYFNDEEIEAFCSEYLEKYPEYQALDNSCQIFVKRLFTFLTSGQQLEDMSDNEYLEGWKFFLELGTDR